MNRNRKIISAVAILLALLMIGSVLLSAVPAFAITKSEYIRKTDMSNTNP